MVQPPPNRQNRGGSQQGSDQPVNLRQQENFSSEQLAKREQAAATEVGETYRQILRQAERVQRGEAKIPRRVAGGLSGSVEKTPAERLREKTYDYLERTGQDAYADVRQEVQGTAAWMRDAETNFAKGRVEYASELLDKFNQTREGQDLSKFPYLQELRREAEKYGTKLSDDDINNLVLWGQLDQAADAYIRHAQMGNYVMAQNVVKTLSDPNKGNLVMASLFPTVVENKVKELTGLDVKDPDTLDSFIGKIGRGIGTVLDYATGPGEEVYKYLTAGAYEQASQGGTRGLLGLVAGGAGIRLGASAEAYQATEKGKFNENYLQRLVGNPEEGLWTELEVELARDVVRRQILGEPNAVAAAWNAREDRENFEVAQFFTNIQFTFGPDGERINKLIRQIQSVDLSSFAAINSGAADPDLQYSPTRGDEWFKNVIGISDIGVRIAGDPLNVIPIPIRAGTAAKWAIGKLAPGAVDEFGNLYRAQDILKKRNLAGFTVNTPASRYFDNFAQDLNKLDDLETAIADATTKEARAAARQRAADFRRRMGRQYQEMPEELIESFRNNPEHIRNAEGRFDLDTVAKFIDDTNDTWFQMQGKLATKAARDGVVEAADLAAIDSFLQQRPLFSQAVTRTTETRALTIPRRGPLGVLRQNVVNNIIADVMPTGNARKILANSFDDTLTPAEIAQRLDDNFLQMGRELAKNRGAGRWFSSIPSGVVINLDNASDAREFYRFARQFMDRSTASFLADAFRLGTPGSRRTLVAATVRSAAASRGEFLTRTQVDEWISRVSGAPTKSDQAPVTGSAPGEAYSVAIDLDKAKVPSAALADFRRQKAAMARATTPGGVQERLTTPQIPIEEGIGRIPRRFDENGELQLSLSKLDFQATDETFNDLFEEVSRLFKDPNASDEAIEELGTQLSQRESFLNAIYDREVQLLDIDKNISRMPRTRVNEDGTTEVLFPGHDESIIASRAEQMLKDIDPPAPAPSDFETVSGVFMTPDEADLYTKYGFLSDSYLRRAYRNMVKAENARARIPEPPKIPARQAELTPPDQPPLGGTEVFAFRLQRPDVDEESYASLMNKFGAAVDEVDTNFGYGEIVNNLQEFDPVRSKPGYKPPKRRKGKPELTTEEKIAIRDGSIDSAELFRLVKEEGRSLDPDMAELIRRNYGINVRASARRQVSRPMGIYVEWAENGTEIGRARLLEKYKDEIRFADEQDYTLAAEAELENLPAMRQQRQELIDALRAAREELSDTGTLSAGTIAKLDEINNDVLARVNGNRPIANDPADPIVTASDDFALADGIRTWSPSRDANGMEEAIHQYQIARSVRILSIADIDEIHRQRTLSGRLFGATNTAIGRVVDGWSFATLFGPRFSVRNAIEELLFYVLTGGKVSDLYKGRRTSTFAREARPRFVYENVKGARGEEQQLVIKTNLGLFNRLSRGYTLTGKLRDDMNQEWLAAVIGQNSTRDDFIKAQLAWQAGDTSAYTKLFAKSMMRANGRIPTGLSPREEEALLWIAGSQHGQNLVQNVAEGGNSLLNGRLPSFTEDVARLQDLAPGEADAMMKEFPSFGPGIRPREFGALRPVKFDEAGRQINGQWWWWRELQAIVHADGPIGKLAVKYIGDPDTAKKAIADYVRQDTKWGYRDTWSMFADGRDIDQAASRYFENALRAFQKPSGEINWKLRNMFVEQVDGEDIVNWYKPRKPGLTPFDDFSRGEKVHRVSLSELSKIPTKDRPEFVFGRLPAAPEPVPVLTGWEGLVTKGYGILGRQNARLSREPIFYANYLNMVRQLESGENAMAAAMARAGGREVPSEFDRAIAAEFTNKTATDAAYAMTMAYVDNPANRSLLAWRVRNVARYYRATEDFYRRAKRLAITRPEAYYRAALVYGLLEDTGFIFEDEEGVKYFYYPGNEYVQRAFATLSAVMPDIQIFNWDMASPFQLGGKVTGLTPSLDPRGLAPTAVGPATFPIAAAFELFPPLKELSGLKSLLVGPYVQPEGSMIQLAYNTLTPAGLARLQQLDQDQIDSTTQQAAYDTIKIMVAEGLLDAESFGTETGTPSIESFLKSDVWKQASSVAWGLTLTKFALSWLGPAAPQIYEAGQINPAARDLGISSVDTVFRQLLELNKDEPDPWSSAISMYYAAKIRKNTGQPTKYDPWDSLLPFTLSGSKSATDKLAGLAGVEATDLFVKWTQSQEFKDFDGLPGAAESLMWLAPRQGEFNWQAWGIVTNHYGLRLPKTTEEKLEALFAVEGQYQDTQIRKSFDEIITRLDPRDPDQKKEINRLEKAKQDNRRLNETRNPFWSTMRGKGGSDYNQARLAQSVKQMEIFIESVKESDMKMPSSLVAIDDAIRVYRDFRAAISGLGQKNVELQQKAELTYEMNRVLASIGESDENAKRFIETVLDTLNYGELTQLDPMLVEEGQ